MATCEDTESPARELGELTERLERYGSTLERTADKLDLIEADLLALAGRLQCLR